MTVPAYLTPAGFAAIANSLLTCADEIVEYAGQVSLGMTFLIAGRVRLTTTTEDGTVVPVGTLDEGSFLGLTALNRQPNLAGVYALDEVTALQIDRDHLEPLVMRKPLLLKDFGRLIDERQSKVRQAARHDRPGDHAVNSGPPNLVG